MWAGDKEAGRRKSGIGANRECVFAAMGLP